MKAKKKILHITNTPEDMTCHPIWLQYMEPHLLLLLLVFLFRILVCKTLSIFLNVFLSLSLHHPTHLSIPCLYPCICFSLIWLEIDSSFLECTQKCLAVWRQHFLKWAAATSVPAGASALFSPLPHLLPKNPGEREKERWEWEENPLNPPNSGMYFH